MSLCKARMQPIGLAIKDVRQNPFTERVTGEVMIIHKCLGCGHISTNRIAGDDNPDVIISLAKEGEKEIVLTALYGYDHSQK